MKHLEIFMPGKNDAQKQDFTLELSRLLPHFSFHVEYERNANPYVIEDLLPEDTYALIVGLRRDDVLSLIIMALSKDLPIIFFLDDIQTNLTDNEHYFVTKLMKMKKCAIIESIQHTNDKGVGRLAMCVNNFLNG